MTGECSPSESKFSFYESDLGRCGFAQANGDARILGTGYENGDVIGVSPRR